MKIALQLDSTDLSLPAGIDAVYFGERYCVSRFTSMYSELLPRARKLKQQVKEVFVTVPAPLRQEELAGMLEMLEPLLEVTDGVLCQDTGLLASLAGRTRLIYRGMVANRQSARLLKDALQLDRIRLFPPTLDVAADLAGVLPLELEVQGRIPFGASPRCFTRLTDGCAACGREYRLESSSGGLLIHANSYRPDAPFSAMPFIGRIQALEQVQGVIEAYGYSGGELADLVKYYRGGGGPSPFPGDQYHGLYLGDERSLDLGEPWRTVLNPGDWGERVES